MTRKTNQTFLYSHLMRWEPLAIKGSQGNAWIKTLAKDASSGARTMLVRFDPGFSQKKAVAQWPADIYLLEGGMTSGNRVYEQGTYHYRPGGTAFGPIETATGITRLIFTADSKTKSSNKEIFIQNTNKMPWSPSYSDPDVRKKGVKVLREDKAEPVSILIHGHFVPGRDLPGEKHFHDHHEEAYTLAGETEDYLADVDGHMFWVPGTYICRNIGASAHGDAMKTTVPNMQIIRRNWVGDTVNFHRSKSNIRSKIPVVVELAE